jgi:hypothetical protein
MTSTCKKCGGKKEESDGICDYCHKAQERPSTNQVVGRKAIMPCKKCGGNKAESDGSCLHLLQYYDLAVVHALTSVYAITVTRHKKTRI